MDNNKLIREMLDVVSDSYNTVDTKRNLTEAKIEIEIEGAEVDELLSRLLQLSGKDLDMPAPVDVPTEIPVDPVSIEPSFADNEVCDVCDETLDSCECEEGINEKDMLTSRSGNKDALRDLMIKYGVTPKSNKVIPEDQMICTECGCPLDACECDMSVSTHGPITGEDVTMENADYDYGHADMEDEGDAVNSNDYMWRPSVVAQRRVKGVMGDNPMMHTEGMQQYTKLVDDYVKFISESNNSDGVMSPLSAASKDEFVKDPFADEEIVADGSMSPLSQIKRQKVMR